VDHRIEFSPVALGDLIDLYDFIAERDGEQRAIGYIDRIEECCGSLSLFPNRGTRNEARDLRPGLRILGFERRAVIAFRIQAGTVTILRVLYGGRDVETAFP
jgi:toxin ParE1/3/4